MHMTATNSHEQPLDQIIRQQMNAISALNDSHLKQVLNYSKGFLDKVFPLAQGSHQDVKSYVVYYQHLLAFFADGSNSGLANPTQFVALCGSKEKPQSILLCNAGRHIELVFSKQGEHGAHDCAGIEDVLLELGSEGSHARSTNLQQERWFSMIRGQLQQDNQTTCRGIACYTAKDGGDYRLG